MPGQRVTHLLEDRMRFRVLRNMLVAGMIFASGTCQDRAAEPQRSPSMEREVITLGGGCFWCMEAVFQQLRGVVSVESGFSGGTVENPTYKQVCTGQTGHAEVVQVTFDPKVVALHDVLEVFFALHDPTTLNRQGADVGSQYRSVVFYRSPEQRDEVQAVVRELEAKKAYSSPVVTQLEPFKAFYKAEAYHQDYYEQNSNQPYCMLVISPKLAKFHKLFKDKAK
jgi:peptide-methionine (S)-S-oxide reductase